MSNFNPLYEAKFYKHDPSFKKEIEKYARLGVKRRDNPAIRDMLAQKEYALVPFSGKGETYGKGKISADWIKSQKSNLKFQRDNHRDAIRDKNLYGQKAHRQAFRASANKLRIAGFDRTADQNIRAINRLHSIGDKMDV